MASVYVAILGACGLLFGAAMCIFVLVPIPFCHTGFRIRIGSCEIEFLYSDQDEQEAIRERLLRLLREGEEIRKIEEEYERLWWESQEKLPAKGTTAPGERSEGGGKSVTDHEVIVCLTAGSCCNGSA